MNKKYCAAVALILITLMSGCSKLLEKPEVQVANIKIGETTLLEQDLIVSLKVKNPNHLALSAKGLYFDLTSQGKKIATGQANQAISIPAMGEGTIPLTVQTSVLDWIGLAQGALRQGKDSLDYQIVGYLDDVNGLGRIPFKRDGNFKLPH